MADDIDRAQVEEQRFLAVALLNMRAEALPFTGQCYYCGETIDRGPFCPGSECRDDYDREQKLRRISGK